MIQHTSNAILTHACVESQDIQHARVEKSVAIFTNSDMHQDKNMDKRINGLLSGLEKILSAIAEMRNKGSDSHGIGAKRISLAEHHARLFVNSATTMAEFLLAVSEKASQ